MKAEEFYKEQYNYNRENINPELKWIFNFAEEYAQSQLKERDKEIAHLRGEVKILKPLAEELMSDKTQNKEDVST